MPRQGKSMHVYLDEETRRRMEELAAQHGRTLTEEVEHACRRHAASPPRMVVPPLKEVPPPGPRKRPGRSRKEKQQ